MTKTILERSLQVELTDHLGYEHSDPAGAGSGNSRNGTTDVSHDLMSKIIDGVLEEVAEWQSRPLDTVYPVILLGAIICKVRHEGAVRNKATHLAVGCNADGRKDVLGIWVETAEGASCWLRVMNELKARGVATSWSWSATASRACQQPSRRAGRPRSCRPASST